MFDNLAQLESKIRSALVSPNLGKEGTQAEMAAATLFCNVGLVSMTGNKLRFAIPDEFHELAMQAAICTKKMVDIVEKDMPMFYEWTDYRDFSFCGRGRDLIYPFQTDISIASVERVLSVCVYQATEAEAVLSEMAYNVLIEAKQRLCSLMSRPYVQTILGCQATYLDNVRAYFAGNWEPWWASGQLEERVRWEQYSHRLPSWN